LGQGQMAVATAGQSLLLKRAALSRPSGQWNDDDFDVLADGKVVGRIYRAHAAPVGSPWMWTLALRLSRGPHTDARLRSNARGRDGGVREELAERIGSRQLDVRVTLRQQLQRRGFACALSSHSKGKSARPHCPDQFPTAPVPWPLKVLPGAAPV
jgi:hypothetical protein